MTTVRGSSFCKKALAAPAIICWQGLDKSAQHSKISGRITTPRVHELPADGVATALGARERSRLTSCRSGLRVAICIAYSSNLRASKYRCHAGVLVPSQRKNVIVSKEMQRAMVAAATGTALVNHTFPTARSNCTYDVYSPRRLPT